MNALVTMAHTFSSLAPAASSLLIASVWKGALLVTLVALALHFLPELPAGTRSLVWLCAFGVVLVLPATTWMQAPLHAAQHHGGGLLHADARWSYLLAGLWLCVSLARLAELFASFLQLRRLAAQAVPVASQPALERLLTAGCRKAQLCLSAAVDRPSVVGFFRPRILLALELAAKLSQPELEQVVLHEIEHLRRYDDWTNLLQKISLALLPLHPVIFWLDRRLCLERELACDDGVLRATAARKTYAACLTRLAEQSLLRRSLSLALGAVGSWKPQSEVARRVYRILRAPQSSWSPMLSRTVASTLLAGVLGGAVALGHTPRLVSFTSAHAPSTPASEPVAQLSAADAPKTTAVPQAEARSAGNNTSAPHMVLATARVSASPAHAVTAALLKSATRSTKKEQIVHRATSPQPANAPTFRLTDWHDDEVPMPHFAFAVQQDSQFTYAAVPIRGGWLIVQL